MLHESHSLCWLEMRTAALLTGLWSNVVRALIQVKLFQCPFLSVSQGLCFTQCCPLFLCTALKLNVTECRVDRALESGLISKCSSYPWKVPCSSTDCSLKLRGVFHILNKQQTVQNRSQFIEITVFPKRKVLFHIFSFLFVSNQLCFCLSFTF